MTDELELPRTDAQIIEEYHRLCRDYGYPHGTRLERLMVHEHLQGAQALELEPDVDRLRRDLVRSLALRGADQ